MGGVSVRAGLLRERVEVQRLVTTRDTFGGSDQSWEVAAVLWGGVRPDRGDESLDDSRQSASLSYVVTLRHQGPSPAFAPGMRLRLLSDGRILNIASVVDVDRRRSRVELRCTERPVTS